MSDIEHDYTDEIVCPYCGAIHGDSWEYFRDGNDDAEIKCQSCGKDFAATMDISVSYSTERKEEK